jgi:hypothetical protein
MYLSSRQSAATRDLRHMQAKRAGHKNKGPTQKVHSVKIMLSRHAKRRAKLYEIQETTIEKILADFDAGEGKHELIKSIEGFKYPIKIVISVGNGIITVVTAYPLKRGRIR